jgi:tRNA A-37 threonylcarbamoyl transferase component Bud32
MRDDASASVDRVRALRRRSLARRAWCDATLPHELIHSILRGDPGELLFSSVPLQVKDRCVVARRELVDGPLLIKRHTWGGVWRTFRMAFRESAARRCARLGLYLHRCGILTPCPRAYVDLRVGPWTFVSYLFSDYIEGESLYRYIRFGSQTADELRHVAEQVARIWQKLVELGASHDDMKPENFIIDHNLDVWLIDLERVRLGGNARRQRQRQMFDVQNFLHIRGWHHRADARAIFAEAFLHTRYGDWFRAPGADRATCSSNQGDAQVDTDLSVLVLCTGEIDLPRVRQATDSVRDIADELIFVELTELGSVKVLKRINLLDASNAAVPPAIKASATPAVPALARCPWVLVLKQNERVTPFLAKELQQRIANPDADAAIQIPLERQYFGRTDRRDKQQMPIRLFRQAKCSFEIGETGVNASADAAHLGRLTGTIQACECATVAEFIENLNLQTTIAAMRRSGVGERPHLLRAAFTAARKFFANSTGLRGIRGGWPGLQRAALECVFSWIEEAKLYQLAGEFHHENSRIDSVVWDTAAVAASGEIPAMPITRAA